MLACAHTGFKKALPKPEFRSFLKRFFETRNFALGIKLFRQLVKGRFSPAHRIDSTDNSVCKGASTMIRLLKIFLALGVIGSFALRAQTVQSSGIIFQPTFQQKAMHEFRGVKLGMKRDEVRKALGNPEHTSDDSDDFKLTGDDTMTVRYDNGEVKAIQLAFLDAKNAPVWKDVVGDADVNEMANGAKTARKVVAEEKFWVSIYQSKDGSTTRITISRN
jgi:hypothetical protein